MDTPSETKQHPFPFTEDDVVAAYRKHPEVFPVVGDWITEVWVGDEADEGSEAKCGLCALTMMMVETGTELDYLQDLPETPGYSSMLVLAASRFGVGEANVDQFVRGFDLDQERHDSAGIYASPSKRFGFSVHKKLVAEGLLSK